MVWFLSIWLVFNTFLIMLNGYLRGRLKAWIDAFLGAIALLVIILFFVFFGWKFGVSSILCMFLVGALVKPIAGYVAERIMKRGI